MNKFSQFVLALLVAAPLGACSNDEMHSNDTAAVSGELEQARSEVDRHHRAMMDMVQFSQIPTEANRHRDQMAAISGNMAGMMSGMMSQCDGAAVGNFRGMMGNVDATVTEHRSNELASTSLQDAQSRCTEYMSTVDGMLDNMHDMLGHMGCMMMTR